MATSLMRTVPIPGWVSQRPWTLAVPLVLALIGGWAVHLRGQAASPQEVVRFDSMTPPAPPRVSVSGSPTSLEESPTAATATQAPHEAALLHVRVLDSAGNPVVGAAVSADWRPNMRIGTMPLTSPAGSGGGIRMTDALGAVTLPSPKGQLADLIVTHEGYAPAKTVVKPGATEASMTLKRASSLVLRVIDASTGGPLALTPLTLDVQGVEVAVTTNAEGIAPIAGLAPGALTGEVRTEHFAPQRLSGVVLKEACETTFDIRLGKGLPIRALVLAGGMPVAAASVSIHDRFTAKWLATVPVREDGRIDVPVGLAGHDYLLVASTSGASGQALVLPGGAEGVIHLNPNWSFAISISGDGRPLKGARAWISRIDGMPGPDGRRELELEVDADGRAWISGLTDGVTYRLLVLSEDRAVREWRSIERSAFEGGDLPCALLPAESVRGRVVGPSGEPMAGVVVRVTRRDGDESPALFTTTDAKGNYVFDNLAPGAVNLVPFFPGFDGVRRPATTGDPAADVVIVPL